ncbi:MAG TPA: hypothetical protein VHA13_03295, partial [Gammaproteobacteria bacterium]|nr:hypothetical protein [Gammaproteobacteria bacterium]
MKSDRPKSEETKEEKSESKLGFSLLEALPKVIRTKINSEFLGKDAHRVAALDHAWHDFVMQPQEARLKIKQEFDLDLPSSGKNLVEVYKRLQNAKQKDPRILPNLFLPLIAKFEPNFPPLFFSKKDSEQLDYKQLDEETKKIYAQQSMVLPNTDLLSWLIAEASEEDLHDYLISLHDYITKNIKENPHFIHTHRDLIAFHLKHSPSDAIEPDLLAKIIKSHDVGLINIIINNPQLPAPKFRNVEKNFGNLLEAAGESGNEKLISQFIPTHPAEDKHNKNSTSDIYYIITGLLKGGHQNFAKKLINDYKILIDSHLLDSAIAGGLFAYAWQQASALGAQKKISEHIHKHLKNIIEEGNVKDFRQLLSELPLMPELESDLKKESLDLCVKTPNNSLELTQLLLSKYPDLPLHYDQLSTAAKHENCDTVHYLLTQFSQNFKSEREGEEVELSTENLESLLNLCTSSEKYSLEITQELLNKYPAITIKLEYLINTIFSGSFETFQFLFERYSKKWADETPENEAEKTQLLTDVLSIAAGCLQLNFAAQLLKYYSTPLVTAIADRDYIFKLIIMSVGANKFDDKTGQILSELATLLNIPLTSEFANELLKDANELASKDDFSVGTMFYEVIHYRHFALWLTSPERGPDKIQLNSESLNHLFQAASNSESLNHLFQATSNSSIEDSKLDLAPFFSNVLQDPHEMDLCLNFLKQNKDH